MIANNRQNKNRTLLCLFLTLVVLILYNALFPISRKKDAPVDGLATTAEHKLSTYLHKLQPEEKKEYHVNDRNIDSIIEKAAVSAAKKQHTLRNQKVVHIKGKSQFIVINVINRKKLLELLSSLSAPKHLILSTLFYSKSENSPLPHKSLKSQALHEVESLTFNRVGHVVVSDVFENFALPKLKRIELLHTFIENLEFLKEKRLYSLEKLEITSAPMLCRLDDEALKNLANLSSFSLVCIDSKKLSYDLGLFSAFLGRIHKELIVDWDILSGMMEKNAFKIKIDAEHLVINIMYSVMKRKTGKIDRYSSKLDLNIDKLTIVSTDKIANEKQQQNMISVWCSKLGIDLKAINCKIYTSEKGSKGSS